METIALKQKYYQLGRRWEPFQKHKIRNWYVRRDYNLLYGSFYHILSPVKNIRFL